MQLSRNWADAYLHLGWLEEPRSVVPAAAPFYLEPLRLCLSSIELADRLLGGARAVFDDLVDEAELLRLGRRQELVAFDCGLDRLQRLTGVLDVDLVEPGSQRQDLARLDLDVGRLPLGAARGLVDQCTRTSRRLTIP
jgi:hypothetical protein